MSNWTYTITDQYVYPHNSLYNNALKVKNWFENLGYSQSAIIGIIANMEHESFINPGQQEHGYNGSLSRGYGLVQWTPARDKIYKYDPNRWYDGDVQLMYFMQTIKYSWYKTDAYYISWEEYKEYSGSIYEATATFFYNFERGTWTNELYNYARYWNGVLYGGIDPPEPPDPPTPPHPHPVIDDMILIAALFLSKNMK